MRKNNRIRNDLCGKHTLLHRAAAVLLSAVLAFGVLNGCGAGGKTNSEENAGKTAAESDTAGTEEAGAASAAEKEGMTGAEEAADVIAPAEKDVTQTVTVKAAADGTPTEVRVKDSREEIEEKAEADALPFAVHIRYFLNGQEKKPEEMAGQSGHAVIRFEYENRAKRTAEADGMTVETQVPFVFISAAILSEEYFSNIEVKNGNVSAFKNNTIAFGYALPGWKEALALGALEDRLNAVEFDDMEIEEISTDGGDKKKSAEKKEKEESAGTENSDASSSDGDQEKNVSEEESGPEDEKTIDLPEYVEISADTTDFQVDFTATVVMNGLLGDSDLEIVKDVKELTDGVGKFTEAGDKLQDGTEKLGDGADEFRGYLKQYVDGVSSLSSGASQLAGALSKVYEGIKKAGLDASGTGDTKAVEDALKNLAADGKAVADQLGGLDKLKEAAKNMSAEEMQAAAQAAAAQIAQAASEGASKAVYDALAETELSEEQKAAAAQAAGAAASAAAAQSAKEAVTQILSENGIDLSAVDTKALSAAAEDIQKQMGVLSGFAESLQGNEDLSKQIEEAKKQLETLKSGMKSLQSGSSQLADGISQMAGAGSKLLEGYDALRDGIGQFDEGIREFNEKGIQKLGELAGAELTDTARRTEAMQKADRSYREFDDTVKEDGTPRPVTEESGGEEIEYSVRFIVETEEIG